MHSLSLHRRAEQSVENSRIVVEAEMERSRFQVINKRDLTFHRGEKGGKRDCR